jgi:hypothetical protein
VDVAGIAASRNPPEAGLRAQHLRPSAIAASCANWSEFAFERAFPLFIRATAAGGAERWIPGHKANCPVAPPFAFRGFDRRRRRDPQKRNSRATAERVLAQSHPTW